MIIPVWVVDPTDNNNPFLKIIPTVLFVGCEDALYDSVPNVIAKMRFWWSSDGISWNIGNNDANPFSELSATGVFSYNNGMWAAVLEYTYSITFPPLPTSVGLLTEVGGGGFGSGQLRSTISGVSSPVAETQLDIFNMINGTFVNTRIGTYTVLLPQNTFTSDPGGSTNLSASAVVNGTSVSFTVIDDVTGQTALAVQNFGGVTFTDDTYIWTPSVVLQDGPSDAGATAFNIWFHPTGNNPSAGVRHRQQIGVVSYDGKDWQVVLNPPTGISQGVGLSFDTNNHRWNFVWNSQHTFVNNPNPTDANSIDPPATLFGDVVDFDTPLADPTQAAAPILAHYPLPSAWTAVRYNGFVADITTTPLTVQYTTTAITTTVVDSGSGWPAATWTTVFTFPHSVGNGNSDGTIFQVTYANPGKGP